MKDDIDAYFMVGLFWLVVGMLAVVIVAGIAVVLFGDHWLHAVEDRLHRGLLT